MVFVVRPQDTLETKTPPPQNVRVGALCPVTRYSFRAVRCPSVEARTNRAVTWLECRVAFLSRSDANRVGNVMDEDLAIANASGLCRLDYCLDGVAYVGVGDHDFNF